MLRLFIMALMLMLPCAAHADAPVNIKAALADDGVAPELDADARGELDAFYAARGYRPAWDLSDPQASAKTAAFLDSIEALIDYHGLLRSGYRLAEMRQMAASTAESDRQQLGLLITASLLHLAHDLHGDAVDLDDLYTGWVFHRQPIDIPAQLAQALADGKLEAFFDQIAPRGDAYRGLARALQDYRAMDSKGGWPTVAAGSPLLPGAQNPRVAQLRARLAVEGYNAPAPPQGTDLFDDGLSKALIDYQTRNGLSPDGHAGGKTLEALDTPIATRIAQIRANMERWRHMPDDFPGARYTVVNIPDFSVTVVEDNKLVYRGIVIDGKPDRQTPFIASNIVNMVVNPPWNVPAKLARADILPKLRRDPHYLEKLGFVIDGRTRDPAGVTIDWKHLSDADFNYKLRQSPGDLNSLGQLKFNFANPFDVYMHGTPHQELFQKAERDFSSGCVRLEDPVRVGEILLENNKDGGGWNQQRINAEIDAGKTHWVTLAKPMPVYFLYWTVFNADDGRINFRKDIYNYDATLMQKLKDAEAQETATP